MDVISNSFFELLTYYPFALNSITLVILLLFMKKALLRDSHKHCESFCSKDLFSAYFGVPVDTNLIKVEDLCQIYAVF